MEIFLACSVCIGQTFNEIDTTAMPERGVIRGKLNTSKGYFNSIFKCLTCISQKSGKIKKEPCNVSSLFGRHTFCARSQKQTLLKRRRFKVNCPMMLGKESR